jgi:septal ring factor EnvC (AmiA/AmiB activator)
MDGPTILAVVTAASVLALTAIVALYAHSSAEGLERVRQLVESAEEELRWVRGVVQDSERLRSRVEAVERERDQLREEVQRLRAETERHHRERCEVADRLTWVLDEVVPRLRPQHAWRDARPCA